MYWLTGVTKEYHGRDTVHALRGVDLMLGNGAWLAVQGPTGHGKSTLLQVMGGLDRPTHGSVELDGRDLAQMPEAMLTRLRARSIGFVFQAFNLIPTLSSVENVAIALVPLHVPAGERLRRASDALAAVGLADRRSHLPSELSGGQQQRVAIARALVKDPAVLLADEPTGNLDSGTRDEILSLLESTWRQRRFTLIIVTHDSAVAGRAQLHGLMRDGRLTLTATPTDVGPLRPGTDAPGG
ncbi:MAG TPA: ABC transporter ATP-binding protein [Trebonia sp.]|nr:ABC transporter ATP-binding protein [Trebonia sp.]